MRASENLFDLIKSLNKSEKGYFKKYSALHTKEKDKTYMLLFDAIDKQNKYDENAIKKKFHKEAFVNQLTFTKNYLYNLILKSMRMYRSKKQAEIQLQEMLTDIVFLFDKGLYKQCSAIINRGKPIAEQYEYFSLLLELLRWENKLLHTTTFVNKTEEDISQLFEKIFEICDKNRNINEYTFNESLIFARVQKRGAARKKEDINGYQEIIDKPLFRSGKQIKSARARLSYNLCYSAYHQMKHEHEKALYYNEKSAQWFEQHPHHIGEQQNAYIIALQNLLTSQYNCKKYNEMIVTLKKLKTFPDNLETVSVHIKNNVLFSVGIMEIAICRDTGQFENGIKLIAYMENEWNEQWGKMTNEEDKMLFYYFASCIYFGNENYSVANSYINKSINTKYLDIRSDLYCFTQILALLIHYEKENKEFIEYKVETVKRFFYKREKMYQFEKSIISFFKKTLPKIQKSEDETNAFKNLKTEWNSIFKNIFERKVLEYFDFISWIESKIEGKTFAEVVRGKVAERV